MHFHSSHKIQGQVSNSGKFRSCNFIDFCCSFGLSVEREMNASKIIWPLNFNDFVSVIALHVTTTATSVYILEDGENKYDIFQASFYYYFSFSSNDWRLFEHRSMLCLFFSLLIHTFRAEFTVNPIGQIVLLRRTRDFSNEIEWKWFGAIWFVFFSFLFFGEWEQVTNFCSETFYASHCKLYNCIVHVSAILTRPN